jgi:hypothetical protein
MAPNATGDRPPRVRAIHLKPDRMPFCRPQLVIVVTLFALAATLGARLVWTAPAAASVKIGQTASSPFTCGTVTGTSVLWQHANVTGPSYRVPPGGGVITAWTTGGGPSDGLRARLEVVREAGGSEVVVGESDLETGVPFLNPYTFPARIPVQAGDVLGLEFDESMASICESSLGAAGDVVDGGSDPGAGNPFASVGTPEQGVLNVSATVEPDADHDGFGDESQDSCPSEAAVHTGPCQSGATRVGQTFQPTSPCDQGTYVPTVLPAGTAYAVPASGVVTSWDVEGPPAPHDNPVDFKVFRPTGPPHTYQVIAQGGLQTIHGPGPHSSPFRLPIQAGDVIGFYADSNSGWCGDLMRGAQFDFADIVDVPLGQTTPFTPVAGSNFRVDIAATIEPDHDGDGFGDLSQDQCPTDASRQAACPTPPATAPRPTPAPPPSGPRRRATAPVLSHLAETNRVFAVARASTPLRGRTATARHKVGTMFSFRLDQPATVTVAITAGAKCPRTNSPTRRMRRCTRTVARLTRSAHGGLNKLRFSGRIRGKPLTPGDYLGEFVATSSGRSSARKTLRFSVVTR